MAFGGLDSALSGLRVAQQQMNLISTNVSNVGTEGYTRKILPQSAIAAEGTNVGVAGDPIIRNVDLRLTRDFWTQVSSTEFFNVQGSYLNKVQEFHGPPESETSIAAEIADLRDSFTALSNQPDDVFHLQSTVSQAEKVAGKFNDFADLISQLRNDAQSEINLNLNRMNDLLEQFSEVNKQIKINTNTGKTTAALEDNRDQLVKAMSDIMEVSFFKRGDGVMVVQTTGGTQLADERAEELFFSPTQLNADTYYPASAAGIYVGGNPATNSTAVDITSQDLNGKIGGLVDLRDNVFPQYMAQIDELAHKLATRFQAQGIELYTDETGTIPANTDPVPSPPGPLSPVEYVGFAENMQVNEAILNNNTLIKRSTIPGMSVQDGSSEFLRRVVEFTFGSIDRQEAQGSVDLRVSALPSTLQNTFGLNPSAQILSEVDLVTLSGGGPLSTATGNPFLPANGPPLNDDFSITLDPSGANVPLTIDLQTAEANFPPVAPNGGAQSLVDEMNAQFGALAPPLNNTTATLNPFGQIVINAQVDMDIGPGSMGTQGLSYLGLEEGSNNAENPYFEVQIGKDDKVKVEIAPGETEVDLVNKLNAIPNIDASIDAATGYLSITPGPGYGDHVRIISGPGQSTGGNTVVEELFGTSDPVIDVPHTPFKTDNLGPSADLSTNIDNIDNIVTYAQDLISKQTQVSVTTEARLEDEKTFRDILQKQLLDESGVNIDEELSNLIIQQTAYSAAARTMSTLNEMFRELISII